jgi:hypothetical protein
MMVPMMSVPALLAGICVTPAGLGAQPKGTPVSPVVTWKGTVEGGAVGDKLLTSVVTDPSNLRNLWKALGRKDDSPEIDFERAFVVVEVHRDRILALVFTVDEKGDLAVRMGQAAERKGTEVSYFVGVFLRDGIKSYSGKAIPALK